MGIRDRSPIPAVIAVVEPRPMETVVVVDLIKGCGAAWPRIENDDFLMSIGSTKPLTDAFG